MQEQRELVLRAERLLLHTLAFDFNIEHPYKYLLSTVKEMQAMGYITENCTRELAQIAWNFANDRYLYEFVLVEVGNLFAMQPQNNSLSSSFCKRLRICCNLSR